jgi:hypothetical protein
VSNGAEEEVDNTLVELGYWIYAPRGSHTLLPGWMIWIDRKCSNVC